MVGLRRRDLSGATPYAESGPTPAQQGDTSSMGLILTENQIILRDMGQSFFDEKSPVTRMRALRDADDATGFSQPLWREMGELGWLGIPFPERVGGSAMGYGELGVVLEQCGRVLAPEPFLASILLGGNMILLGGSEELQDRILPSVCTGETVLCLAFEERGRFAPWSIETTAKADGDGWVIDGRKKFVLDGQAANQIVVVARTSGAAGQRSGLSAFVVDAGTAGIRVERSQLLDGHGVATIEFSNVAASADSLIGEVDGAGEVLERTLDRATIGLCAEMVGCFGEAFERTLAYLKIREQFGVKIGTFQALRHRASHMFGELEFARSVVRDAQSAIDEDRDDSSLAASSAKARCSDVAKLIAGEAVQMFGGIGMTDEEEIGLFFKRLKASELTLGDSIYHRDRYATLRGY